MNDVNNINVDTPATFDEIRAILRESAERQAASSAEFDRRMQESRADFDRRMQESRAEFDRRNAEFDRWRQESNAENERRRQEADRRSAEADRRSAEADRRSADFDRQLAELKASLALTDDLVKRTCKEVGGISTTMGKQGEEFFYNSIGRGDHYFFDQIFVDVLKNLKGETQPAEYDLVLVNCTSTCIFEVKSKARVSDVNVLLLRPSSYRINFPHSSGHKIYLGMASMLFEDGVEDLCIKNGIAILKQVGDYFVVNEKHVKVF